MSKRPTFGFLGPLERGQGGTWGFRLLQGSKVLLLSYNSKHEAIRQRHQLESATIRLIQNKGLFDMVVKAMEELVQITTPEGGGELDEYEE